MDRRAIAAVAAAVFVVVLVETAAGNREPKLFCAHDGVRVIQDRELRGKSVADLRGGGCHDNESDDPDTDN